MTLKADILDDLETVLTDWDDITWDAVIYKGIFYNEYEAASLFGGEIESRNPYVMVSEAELTGVDHTDTVTINSIDYKVAGVEPDGLGMLLLRLSKD